MPRKAREKSRTGIYHIMLRGVNRQTIFEDEEDKERFLKTLQKYKTISKYDLYSYCLMDNHVHLLLKEREETVSLLMKRISSSYVYWYNKKYERCGHLFQERFRSESVENQAYFLTVLRYIHQNPLKAGLARNVFENRWTSIHEYIEIQKIIDVDFALRYYSVDRDQAIILFREHMQQTNDDKCLDEEVIILLTDNEVRTYLKEWGIHNASLLQHMEKESRDAVLARLKVLNGVTLRQIERLTGVSKSVIQRARRGD